MLALIAGKGSLPVSLSQELQALDRPHRVLSLEGFEPDLPDVQSFRVEALGEVIADLVKSGAREVCFAGAMQRPPIDPSKLHPLSLPLVPRLMGVLQSGDDALLREVIAIFEEAGLRVRGAHELAPNLLAPKGIIAGAADETLQADAAKGIEILTALSSQDIGQGCVVAHGHCLGIETLQGTDAMLSFVAGTRALVSKPSGGVLVKRAKDGQDLRIDMPSVGANTIRAMAEAGLSGLCIQAGRVLLLERPEMLEEADKSGITIWGSD